MIPVLVGCLGLLSYRRLILFLPLLFGLGLAPAYAQYDLESAPDSPAGQIRQDNPIDREAARTLGQMSREEIADLDRRLAKALTLYYDRDFARALPIFNEITGKVVTMDLLFWQGMSELELGRAEVAAGRFEKMLAANPDLQRVRLELATAYFKLGRHNEARAELEKVLAASPPDGVRQNIQKMLAAIDTGSRSLFHNLRVSVGYMWDSNVSSGPDQKELAVLGGILTLDKESRELEDEALVTNLAGNLLWDAGASGGLLWNTALSFYDSAYSKYSQFNFRSIDLATGPWWSGNRSVFKLPVGYTEQEFGSDRLSYAFHLDPSYTFYMAPRLSITLLYALAGIHYYADDNSPLDTDLQRFEFTPAVYLGAAKNQLLSLTAGYEDSHARSDRFSYEGPYWAVSYFAGLAAGTEIFLKYQMARRDYEAAPVLFSDLRADERHSFQAVVTQGFYGFMFASLAYSYMNNHSNNELYDFDRSTVSFSIGCRF